MKSFKKLNISLFLKVITLGLFATFFSSCEQEDIAVDSNELTQVELSSSSELANYSSSFLPDHEDCGGHTIERHIEKSDSYLYGRLSSGISAASTFYDYNQAGQVIYNAIYNNSYNASRLNSWLNSSSTSYLVLYYTHGSILGKVLTYSSSTESNKIKVILSKSSCISYDYNYDNDYDFTIVTAYPY